MRFKEYLQEEYFKRITVDKDSWEIFKNSSKTELFKLFKQIPTSDMGYLRGLIDKKTNDFYVFSDDCLHWDAAPTINHNADEDNYNEFFWSLILAKQDGFIYWDTLAEFRKEDIILVTKILKDKGIPIRYNNNLYEEYVGSFNAGNKENLFTLGYTEVMKNPSVKEIKSILETSPWWEHIKNSCRFILDFNKKNLFVFKPTTYHASVANYLVDENEISSKRPNDDIVWGEAQLKNGYLKYMGSDTQHDFDDIIKKHGKTEGWTKKWFSPSFLSSVERDKLHEI
jgi:hypothetical protein